ncbi:hypothetical protein JRQ81_018382 [Phrynocephalus forsythii]|uniref:Meiosis-specific coiled-coil domain-containing protein MEIOC n=1 Tax=Phrynocephalus forsythii TaxID=171643 RepID=A0A9Q0XPF9_9SAUR|nr:hypothetical protein JRQ81_018382 [Phrynocephalus forsythii]
MVAGGARSLAAPFPGGAPRPEVESNLCWFENVSQLGENSLHTGTGDMVKQSITFSCCKLQVNSTQEEMDTQFFSPAFGGITDTPSSVGSSQLYYSGWSACGDDADAVAALQDCTPKRAQVNSSSSGSGPDMFGLVANILEEPEKQETTTDWNSLSRLFPPVWSSAVENKSFSELFPMKGLGNDDLTSLVDIQKSYEENWQKASSVELLRNKLSDLNDIGSWESSGGVCVQSPENVIKNSAAEAEPLKSIGINQSIFVCVKNYDKNSHGSSLSTYSKIKDSTHNKCQKPDRGRGVMMRNHTEGSNNHFTQLSNSPVGGIWDPVIQENNLCLEKYMGFTDTRGCQQFSYTSEHFLSPALNKDNSFLEGIDTKFQEDYQKNSYHSISMSVTCHGERKVPQQPQKTPCSQASVKPSAQDVASPYNGYTWLEVKRTNLEAGSCATYGKQKERSFVQSSGPSSKYSPGQMSYSQKPPLLSSRSEGKQQLLGNIPSISGFSTTENQKQRKPFGHSQNHSLATPDGQVFINVASSCLLQQRSANESAKHNRFYNKQNRYKIDERTGQNERRQRQNLIPHTGCVSLDQPQLDIWGRKPEPNGAALSDFINPSFLPLVPLVSGFKHMPNFPPFSPHPFSSPTNVAFSLLPFPWSELADLPYDDLPHLSPFLNDLFCGEVAPPYFAFPPPPSRYRPPRNRSGPASELHIHLEECYEQWRALEREREKTEADLARRFPGKRVSVSNNAPFSRLPAKPSRVDRLIVDQFREQARVHSLIGKMEQLCGIPVHRNISATLGHHLEAICATQAKRKEEIMNAVNPQRLGTSRYRNEKDVLALAAAVKDLAFFTRKTRTALWCSFQMTLPTASALVKEEEVQRALQELCPVRSSLPGKTRGEQEDKENKKENPNEPRTVVH